MRLTDSDEVRDLRHTVQAVLALCAEPGLGRERVTAEAAAAVVTLRGSVSSPGLLDSSIVALRRLAWVREIRLHLAVEPPGPDWVARRPARARVSRPRALVHAAAASAPGTRRAWPVRPRDEGQWQ